MINPFSREVYASFLADFDPSPIEYGDDWLLPPTYETWVEECLDELGLY
jgi:hypothetical protein